LILADLKARDSHREPEKRFRYKLGLVRHLYEKAFGRDGVRKLFRFIDWIMELPDEFDLKLRDRLIQIEEEKKMPTMSSVERIAKAEGKAEGRVQTLQELRNQLDARKK